MQSYNYVRDSTDEAIFGDHKIQVIMIDEDVKMT